MTARIAVYIVIGAIALVALMGYQERAAGGNEERERAAVAHALQWHKSYVVSRTEAHKLEIVAKRAVAKSEAFRDSVRVISDTTVLIEHDTVVTPRVIIRRLVADSVTISQLTQLVAVQATTITLADSTIAAYQVALTAAQANKCRLFWKVPCPSRKTTALLTAGGLLLVKLTLGAAL
jgi:hypothetical protein